ncbi:MAG: HAD-IA family hydrolase [Candidatus Micrarchaeota archaeon]
MIISIRYGTWVIFAVLLWMFYSFLENNFPLLALFAIVDYYVATKIFYYIRLRTSSVMCFDVNGVLVNGDFKKERLSIMPGIYDLLNNLRQTHVLVVIGNNNEVMAEALYKNKGFDKYFDHHFQSSAFGTKKPDPEYFKAVAHKLGISTHSMVFADDLEENVDGAKKAGCGGVTFTTTEKYRSDLATIGIRA